jgi:hypothetical protein
MKSTNGQTAIREIVILALSGKDIMWAKFN